MIVADTNVWARAQLNDDPVQARKARKVLSDAMAGAGVFDARFGKGNRVRQLK